MFSRKTLSNSANARAISSLPNVKEEMLNPEYWISKCADPDQLFLNTVQIKTLNERIASADDTVNLFYTPPQIACGTKLKDVISTEFSDLKSRQLYLSSHQLIIPEVWTQLLQNLNLAAIPSEIKPQFGLLTAFSSQRLLPTSEAFYADSRQNEFDQLQNSGYEIGTPHLILHKSLDSKWIYTTNKTYSGWYPSESMAICNEEQWMQFLQPDNFVLIDVPKADLWRDKEQRKKCAFIRLGNTLPLIAEHESVFEVSVPQRLEDGSLHLATAFLKKDMAQTEYVPYTTRNVLNIAFKMLGQAYAWGDFNGDWDCSSLLKATFGVFGIELPRNGGNQDRAGKRLLTFSGESERKKEESIIKTAIPGISLIRFPGHIMLYLGETDGKAFVLHDVYAYAKPVAGGKDQLVKIKHTTISDLHLGKGSSRGSWLQRVTGISALSLDPHKN